MTLRKISSYLLAVLVMAMVLGTIDAQPAQAGWLRGSSKMHVVPKAWGNLTFRFSEDGELREDGTITPCEWISVKAEIRKPGGKPGQNGVDVVLAFNGPGDSPEKQYGKKDPLYPYRFATEAKFFPNVKFTKEIKISGREPGSYVAMVDILNYSDGKRLKDVLPNDVSEDIEVIGEKIEEHRRVVEAPKFSYCLVIETDCSGPITLVFRDAEGKMIATLSNKLGKGCNKVNIKGRAAYQVSVTFNGQREDRRCALDRDGAEETFRFRSR